MKQLTKAQIEEVNEIMENFDFAKVHRAMTLLKWKWFDVNTKSRIPNLPFIKAKARELLERGESISTRGFTVERRRGYTELSFRIAHYYTERLEE